MYRVLDKIDKAMETKERVTLIHKMGGYYHGLIADSWVRMSGGKLRGKVRFASEEKGEFEVDANDILDLLLTTDGTNNDKNSGI